MRGLIKQLRIQMKKHSMAKDRINLKSKTNKLELD